MGDSGIARASATASRLGERAEAPPAPDLHSSPRASPLGRPAQAWPFVDRDGKLGAALAALADADPGAVIISGAPGVGRTRLAQEVLSAARSAGRRAEWVTGTRTTAAMQLDALGHLVGGAADPATAWLALVATLAPHGDGGSAVLCIDDAHLLNDFCASLVHRLVLTRSATLVMTLSSDAPAPDLIDALWRDGLAPRVELAPLTYEHVEQLLTAGLGGIVESRACQELWQASRGSAVFLHELAEAGRSAGRLAPTEDIWRWHGELMLTPRVRAVVLGQIGDLSPAAQAAVELLAIGGSLELQDFVAASSPEVVAALERRGVVRVDRVGRQQIARLTQPLHAEVLRDQLPETLAAQYRQQLAAAPSVQRWLREDPVQVSGLLLQPDFGPAPPGARTRAAVQANARSDHLLAEQLARRALEDGPDLDASIALAEALRWQGSHDEAERIAVEAAIGTGTDDQRQRLATTRMLNAFFGARSHDAAEAVCKEATTDADGAACSLVDVLAAILRLSSGDPTATAELCNSGPPARVEDDCLRLWTSAAATLGAALHGRPQEAAEHARRGWAAWAVCDSGTEIAFARALLMHGEVLALGLAGRVPDAEARAAALHRATLARPASACDTVAALGLGTAALLAGRPREASRWLTEATVQASERDPFGLLSVCWALRAEVAALQGDAAAARTAAERADAAFPMEAFEPVRHLAHAWAAAAERRLPEAEAAALRAAASAHGLDQRAVEAGALHTTVRMGNPAAALPRLQALAEELGGELVRSYATQARALLDGDGDRLDQVAAEYEELGALGLAADAAAQAVEAHRDAGSRRSASASVAQAVALARLAGPLHTPALERLASHSLTDREREIAAMAARGARNTEIARRLVLSVRTVETHLAHVYDKLGINNRAALKDAMTAGGWLPEAPGNGGNG